MSSDQYNDLSILESHYNCFLLRKMARGDTVVHLLAGKAHLQREAVRFLWESFLETSLRMNWCRSVKK